MKRLWKQSAKDWIVILCLLSVGIVSSGHAASFTINIFFDNGGQKETSVNAFPGDTLNLFTEVTTDQTVAGLEYRITMPTAGWTLQSRDYFGNGWESIDVDSNSDDTSGPSPSKLSQEIIAGSDGDITVPPEFYTPTAALDFRFNSLVQSSGTKTGTFKIEDLSVTIPSNISQQAHLWDLSFFGAFDGGGGSVTDGGTTVTVNDFTFQVIPEPSTYVMMAVMLLGITAYGRRKKPVGRRQVSEVMGWSKE